LSEPKQPDLPVFEAFYNLVQIWWARSLDVIVYQPLSLVIC